MTRFKWQPIEDYGREPSTLAVSELRALSGLWEEQREQVEAADAWAAFLAELKREWAIETGLLERLYTLDRGLTQTLIEQGIDASLIPHSAGMSNPERVVAIIRDQERTVDGLFDFVKGARPLSTSYIKEVHAALTRSQETIEGVDSLGHRIDVRLQRGEYKKLPNNPTRPDGSVHEYCPPEHVASEMDRLLGMHAAHGSALPEVEAAWLHHRFTQIHPFQDGNGRVARCLATLVFLRTGWFPLVVKDEREERGNYLSALEEADSGNLEDLVQVFARAQKRAFLRALGTSGRVLSSTLTEHVIAATREMLERREQLAREERRRVLHTGDEVRLHAYNRMLVVREMLTEATTPFLKAAEFAVYTEPSDGNRAHWFRRQAVEVARHLGYFANFSVFRCWSRLVLRTVTQSEILVLIHGLGFEFVGVLGVSACYLRREQTESGDRETSPPTVLCSEVLQLNYLEDDSLALSRFGPWFERALAKGLEIWRREIEEG